MKRLRAIFVLVVAIYCLNPSANAQYADIESRGRFAVMIGGKNYGLQEYELVPYANFWTNLEWGGRNLLRVDSRLKPLLGWSGFGLMALGSGIFFITKMNRQKAAG